MGLNTTSVSQCLDKRLTIFGFEVLDLLAIFFLLSVLNFLFGRMSLLMVWTPALALAAILRLGKKGKPENHLVHWLRFQISPGVYAAFSEPGNDTPPPSLKEGSHRE